MSLRALLALWVWVEGGACYVLVFLFFILCVWLFYLHVCLHHMFTWAHESQKRFWIPESRLRSGVSHRVGSRTEFRSFARVQVLFMAEPASVILGGTMCFYVSSVTTWNWPTLTECSNSVIMLFSCDFNTLSIVIRKYKHVSPWSGSGRMA